MSLACDRSLLIFQQSAEQSLKLNTLILYYICIVLVALLEKVIYIRWLFCAKVTQMSSAPVSGAMSSRKAWLSPASKSLLAQSTLYVLAVGCFVQFLIVLYGRFLPWWNQSQSFIKMRDAMTIPFPGNVPVKTKVGSGHNMMEALQSAMHH